MPKKSRLRCFFGCKNDGPLHLFPNPKTESYEVLEKFNVWKSMLPATLQEKGDNYIFNTIRLCNNHFLEGYCLPSHRLTKNAVPTLNLEPQLVNQSTNQHSMEEHNMLQPTSSATSSTSAAIITSELTD
ncbi:unnamed protein product [Colias eurytheme]|nr:unnamed protein product [Colias eurytheme]